MTSVERVRFIKPLSEANNFMFRYSKVDSLRGRWLHPADSFVPHLRRWSLPSTNENNEHKIDTTNGM